MLSSKELKEIAGIRSEDAFFVSFYLNVNPMTNVKDNYAIHVKNMLKQKADQLDKAVMKKVAENPVIKSVQKERQDRFLVNSFTEAQKAFPDIKKPEDIPVEVWNAWDEGKSKRTLLSHLKEHRYDSDIENARKSGANQVKATVMSTAHTAQVNGTTAASEYDNVIVPDAVRRNLELVGIKDPLKQKMAYAKHGLKR